LNLDLDKEALSSDPKVPIAEAWMPTSTWYTAPEFLTLEQLGLGASSYDRGRRALRVEAGEFRFHQLLAWDDRRALGLAA